eukprot:11214804-Lingulodinium_polyedra.AAC.1
MRDDAVKSTFRSRAGARIARGRFPCAGRFSVRAWGARARDLRAAPTAKRAIGKNCACVTRTACAISA